MNAIDARGTRHRRCDDHVKLRIVSLVPSLTELLCDLGLGARVVGRTGSCVHPGDEVARIATVDAVTGIDLDKVRQLAPTHLVVDVDDVGRSRVAALEAFVPHVVVTRVRTPRDNLRLYRLFGHVFACERDTDRLCARFEAAWETLLDAQRVTRPIERRVLVVLDRDPWTTIAVETYLAAMLALIGWQQVGIAADARDDTAPSSPRHPAIDLDRAARDAEFVLLDRERFTDSHVAMLNGRGLKAKSIDTALLSRYGSGAIAGLDYLGRLVLI